MLNIVIKSFEQLTTTELYQLLQLRSEVFVVEQDCVYQDMDGKDEMALHVLGYHDDQLAAYTRLFKPGDYFKESSIGRVVVKDLFRKHGYGYNIMEASIDYLEKKVVVNRIEISAQTYLKRFYNNLKFKEVGEGYLEDGIPHIKMVRD